MGACKSRQSKTAAANQKETPLLTSSTSSGKQKFQLRPDAQPYVPPYVVPDADDEPEVKEPWEIFLDQKKRDFSLQQRGLMHRVRDGTYTGEYKNLLTRPDRPPPGLGGPRSWRNRSPSPTRQNFDLRGAWRSAQKRVPSPSKVAEEKATAKKRKPTALKKAILAQRDDSKTNALWQKFEDYVQKMNAKEDAAPAEAPKVAKDDSVAPSEIVPFALSDRCYLSEMEDKKKAQRHIEESHALIREYVDTQVTPELEEAVTETLYTLRRLRMQELGLGQKSTRYAVGFREVSRLITKEAVSCLVVAPDVERTSGALEGKIASLVEACKAQKVPVVFALSRKQLGQAIQKNVTVSVLAIQTVRGAVEPYTRMLEAAKAARGLAA